MDYGTPARYEATTVPLEVAAPGGEDYCPWRHLSYLEGVTLTWHDGGVLGVTTFNTSTISLKRGLSRVQQRCTLAHEIVHIERGPGHGPEDTIRARLEERLVHLTAAMRLIPAFELEDLAENAEREGHEALAERLAVDAITLRWALEAIGTMLTEPSDGASANTAEEERDRPEPLTLVPSARRAAVIEAPRQREPQPTDPRLPVQPLLTYVRLHGGPAGAGFQKSSAEEKALERAQRDGWLTVEAADRIALRALGTHPMLIWGDEYLDV